MLISGIRTQGSFYNSIASVNKITQAKEATLAPVEAVSKAPEVSQQPSVEEIAYARRNQNETSYDYAQRYDANASYSAKGKDVSLESLDIENAITSMQKDQLLQQYRFFVDEPKAASSAEELAVDQAVRPTENFIL